MVSLSPAAVTMNASGSNNRVMPSSPSSANPRQQQQQQHFQDDVGVGRQLRQAGRALRDRLTSPPEDERGGRGEGEERRHLLQSSPAASSAENTPAAARRGGPAPSYAQEDLATSTSSSGS